MPLMSGVVLESIDQHLAFIQTDFPMPLWTALEISMVLDDGLRVPAVVEQVNEACRTKPQQADMVAGMQVRLEDLALTLLFGSEQDPEEPVAAAADDFESLQPAPIVGDLGSDPEVLEDSSPDLVASVSTSRISRKVLEEEKQKVLEEEKQKEPEGRELPSVATGEFEIPASSRGSNLSMSERNHAPDKVIIDIGEDEPQELERAEASRAEPPAEELPQQAAPEMEPVAALEAEVASPDPDPPASEEVQASPADPADEDAQREAEGGKRRKKKKKGRRKKK